MSSVFKGCSGEHCAQNLLHGILAGNQFLESTLLCTNINLMRSTLFVVLAIVWIISAEVPGKHIFLCTNINLMPSTLIVVLAIVWIISAEVQSLCKGLLSTQIEIVKCQICSQLLKFFGMLLLNSH